MSQTIGAHAEVVCNCSLCRAQTSSKGRHKRRARFWASKTGLPELLPTGLLSALGDFFRSFSGYSQ